MFKTAPYIVFSLNKLRAWSNVDSSVVPFSPSSKNSPVLLRGIYTSKFISAHVSDWMLTQSANKKEVKQGLELLEGLDRVHINQTKTIRQESQLHLDSGISLIEMEVCDRKNSKLFNVEFQRGSIPAEFYIKLFGPRNESLLSLMHLEPCLHLKTVFLRVMSPPGKTIGSIYDIKGISKVAIIEDEEKRIIFQVLSNGGFGWTTSAKILTPTGEDKVGKIFRMSRSHTKHSLSLTIDFPPSLDTRSKVSLIGAGLILMGQDTPPSK